MKKGRMAILFATVLVDMVGFGIVLPLLPFYAEDMGASPFMVTVVIASFSAAQLAAAPVWGRVSDRQGRRPLIIAGLFASAASYALFAVAETLLVLLLSRVAAGAAGGTISVAQAYVADSTEEEDRAHGLGLLGAASGIGVMVGPAIGGFFSQWGLGAPGWVAAGLCTANGIAALFLLPESFTEERQREAAEAGQASTVRGWVESLLAPRLRKLLGIYFLSITSFTAMTAVLALYVERVFGMDAGDMGVVFTLAGGCTVLVRGGLVGWLARKLGEHRLVRAGALLLAITLASLPVIPSRWWLGGVVPLWALATGILFPSLASMVSRTTDLHSQGSIMGGSQIVGGLGRVLGPIWAGVLFERLAIGSPFLVGAGLVSIALASAMTLSPPAGREEETSLAAVIRPGETG